MIVGVFVTLRKGEGACGGEWCICNVQYTNMIYNIVKLSKNKKVKNHHHHSHHHRTKGAKKELSKEKLEGKRKCKKNKKIYKALRSSMCT